jgi:hypothetical protein
MLLVPLSFIFPSGVRITVSCTSEGLCFGELTMQIPPPLTVAATVFIYLATLSVAQTGYDGGSSSSSIYPTVGAGKAQSV